jgi:formate hydrogenlyase transcriptional activator
MDSFGSAPAAFSGTESRFEGELIGASPSFERVLSLAAIVAPTDSAVLLQGETGSGKELIAREIHRRSLRRDGPFVELNCSAIPGGLLESELFGHERGAFTGALTQSVGRFQLAHHGTLFLDEIGDLPLELQPKLLRALQKQEFERLGSTHTIRVDVRVITATNQDLFQMVRDRGFRADLYYRLNVFPITLPPLRERMEDIPLLARYFVRKYSHRMNKRVEAIPDEVIEILKHHDWPGNVRELQNFVERGVILSTGSVFRPPLEDLKHWSKRSSPETSRTLAEAERQHILEALDESNWVVGGRSGAAARLGLPRTTLVYKMRRLGITRGLGASSGPVRPPGNRLPPDVL